MEDQLLNHFCKLIRSENELELKPRDLADKGVRQAKNYLAKVAKIDIDYDRWNILEKIGKIRNQIVHNRAEIKNIKPDLETYLNKNDLISERGSIKKIQGNLSYCKDLIDFGYDFWTSLYYKAGRTSSPDSFKKNK